MKKQKTNQKGITLIALVISIIVMLILAGVSLNMTVGDNGIITQAQHANYAQSCAVLEEYLHTIYAQNYESFYDNSDDERNELEKMIYKYSDWFYHNGSYDYVLTEYEHKDESGNDKLDYLMIRLINKDNLPKEIKKQVKGGGAKNNSDEAYQNFQDVYGVTSNLQVFYCSDGLDTIIGADYHKSNIVDGRKIVYSQNSAVAKMIANSNGTSPGDLDLQSLRGQREIVVDSSISNLEFLYDMPNIEKITLTNYRGSLSGLEKAYKLKYLKFNNSDGSQNIDYTGLEYATKITELYVYNPTDTEVEKMFDRMNKSDYKKLTTIALYGNGTPAEAEINSNIHTQFTAMQHFSKLSKDTRAAVSTLYLNNNSIKTVQGLNGFSNLELIRLDVNYLEDISGISEATKLNQIGLSYNSPKANITNGITSLNALNNLTELKKLFLKGNSGITSLATCITNKTLEYLDARNVGILDFDTNTSVWTVANLNKLGGIASLYLDSDYSLLFSNKAVVILSTSVTDEQVAVLKGNTHVIDLYAPDNKEITNGCWQSLLPQLPNLKHLDVSGTNIEDFSFLDSMTQSQLDKINGICCQNSKIKDLKKLEKCENMYTLTAWGTGFNLVSESDSTVALASTQVLNNIGENVFDTDSNRKLKEITSFKQKSLASDYCSSGYLPHTSEMCSQLGQLTNLEYWNCYTNSVLPASVNLANTKVKKFKARQLMGSSSKYITLPDTITDVTVDSNVAPVYIESDKSNPKIDLTYNSANVYLKKHIEGCGIYLSMTELGNSIVNSQSLLTDAVKSFNLHQPSKTSSNWLAVDYSNCTSLTTMTFNWGKVVNLDCNKLPSTLTSITMKNSQIQNINNYSNLSNITNLNVSYNQITNLDFLCGTNKPTTLTSINLSNNYLGNLTTYVDANGNTQTITTAKALADITSLNTVELSGNSDLTNFEALINAGFKNVGNNKFVKQ